MRNLHALYACRQAADVSLCSCSDFVTSAMADRAVVRDPNRCHSRAVAAGWCAPETIIFQMARGWESKSVEAQQAEAAEKLARTRPPMTAKEAARCRARENFRLARQRVLKQMEVSSDPRHRRMLEDALADLDQKLSAL